MSGYTFSTGLGMPGAGFASRGKGNRPQRLTLASPPKVGSISENCGDGLTNPPRTSRSHLLAGLRTQPRTPNGIPASAPYNKTSHGRQAMPARVSQLHQNPAVYREQPHTAIGSGFSIGQQPQFSLSPGQQLYGLPEQVLAPPPLDMDEHEEKLDPQLAAQLYATQLYLQERQLHLQQMTLSNQIARLNIQEQQNKLAQAGYPETPNTPHQMPMFAQSQVHNLGNGMLTQEVPGQPGLYVVFNMFTGQSTLAVDSSTQVPPEVSNSPPPYTPNRPVTAHGRLRESEGRLASRSCSPPKRSSLANMEVAPLPPPTANAFRRNHNRNRSSLALSSTGGLANEEHKPLRPCGIPATPMTGTFAPGHGRAGIHPCRQPIGPCAIEELQKAPTAKCEGGKNFSARQRRRALNTLVRAGLERRVARPDSGNGSAGSTTPISDSEKTFSLTSDNDSDCDRSLHGRSSLRSFSPLDRSLISSERLGTRKPSHDSLFLEDRLSVEDKPLVPSFLIGLGAPVWQASVHGS